MTVLLAREFEAGRFQKVLTFAARKDAGGSLAMKWNGTVESLAVRNAAKYFAAEPAAVTVFSEYGGHKFRCDRIA